MNLTKASFISSEKLDSFQYLSIVNYYCNNEQKNKIQLKFFKYIIKYQEQEAVTVLDILK